MTICDKINEVGEILEENLNDRGVSCTFGTGTGESTVLEMVEMVNGTNFKGSSDVNLKIGANRPYLLENETTDVVVKLENGLCEPLKNKNVTIEQSLFRDNGTTTSHNDNWSGLSYMTRDDNGTTISNTGTGSVFNAVRMNNNNLGFANTSYVVEFEIVENPSSTNRFRFDGQTICDGESYAQYDFYFGQNETGKFKFVYDSTNNTIAKYKNGIYVATYNHHFCGNMGFLFRIESGASIKYKDFIIYKTINGVTDEKGEFALYDVSVTDDTTFTATYGTETATCLVEYCSFVDYATTSKHNDNYDNLSYLTRSDAYTIASNTSGSSKLLPTKVSSNLLYVSSTDYEVCITILEVSGSDNRIRLTSDATSSSYWDFTLTQNTVGQYRFVYDGTNHAIKRYKNGILENTIEKTLGSNKGCTLRIANNASFKYCDLRVKAL